MALHCCSDESHRIRKIERWMWAFDHYTSNITVLGQFNWVLKNNELSKEALKTFLNATISIVRSAAPIFSAQMNECFNSIKARYASKLLNWKCWFVERMCMAVLQINNPYKWVNDLRRVLKLPLLPPSKKLFAFIPRESQTIWKEGVNYTREVWQSEEGQKEILQEFSITNQRTIIWRSKH